MSHDFACVHRWNDLPVDHPMDRIERRRVIGDKTMLSHVVLQEGFALGEHAHKNEQFAIVLSGCVEFTISDARGTRTEIVRGGEVLHLPSNVPHAALAIETSTVIDVFTPPSELTGIDHSSS